MPAWFQEVPMCYLQVLLLVLILHGGSLVKTQRLN